MTPGAGRRARGASLRVRTAGRHTGGMPTVEEVEAQLLGPGGMFEIGEEDVLGERMHVFKQRVPSLRAFVERSAGFGDAEYVVFGDRRITFAQHERAVASVANALRERFGVAQGDRVAILAANCPEWIVTFWATVSLGAIAVGLNGWWTADEILYGVGDCEPKLLVADREAARAPRGASPGVPVVEIESQFDALWNHDLAGAAARRSDRRGRPGDHPLHERHDRTAEGRHAEPPQRGAPSCRRGLHGRRA